MKAIDNTNRGVNFVARESVDKTRDGAAQVKKGSKKLNSKSVKK